MNNNCGCSKGKCCFLALFCGLLFVFLYEFLVHGILLKGAYESTAALWRPESEMSMGCMLFCQFLFVCAMCFLFSKNNQGTGAPEGFRFGLYTGLLLAVVAICSYNYLPIPMSLAIAWFFAALFKGIGTGVVISLFCRNKN